MCVGMCALHPLCPALNAHLSVVESNAIQFAVYLFSISIVVDLIIGLRLKGIFWLNEKDS